jgi:hypothetical protein
MRILTTVELMQEFCKQSKRFGMFVSFDPNQSFEETGNAAPYLNPDASLQALCNGEAVLIFDTREEMEGAFELTVGEDGLTVLNPYAGPAKVYAATCNDLGEIETENT